MHRTDLLLRIITAALGEPVTPVVLQKVTFLVAMEFPNELPHDFYEFQKYDYGPFCAQVYQDAELLAQKKLVLITVNQRGGWNEYLASYKSGNFAFDDIPEHISTYIDETVEWARNLSFQGLVREIYKRFPQFRENSVFQG